MGIINKSEDFILNAIQEHSTDIIINSQGAQWQMQHLFSNVREE
jgi:hypothetical protein